MQANIAKGLHEWAGHHGGQRSLVRPAVCAPNLLVRWACYLSAFAIPFSQLYLPGTGERIGATRVVQFLMFAAIISQPRVCLRFVPVALFWFVAYAALRIIWGFWFAPELFAVWWPSSLHWLQFSLPWLWLMFNVLQFPKISRRVLWALVWGCSLCALLHIGGIGTEVVGAADEGRSSVFGENANVIGSDYAIALIVLIGLGMFHGTKLSSRLLIIPLICVVGIGLAKTGSRTGILLVVLGVVILLFQAGSVASRVQRYSVLLLAGLVLAAVIYQMPTVMKRFATVNSSAMRDQEPRARMLPVLWEIFLRSPIYGSGPDQYQFELTRRAMPYLVREQKTISAHNLLLLLLVETGAIGLFLFAFGLKEAMVAAWRGRHACGWLPLAMIAPLVIAGATCSNPSSSGIFWLAIAYALSGCEGETSNINP